MNHEPYSPNEKPLYKSYNMTDETASDHCLTKEGWSKDLETYKLSGATTSGSLGAGSFYFQTLAKGLDIFSEVISGALNLPNNQVRETVFLLLLSFQKVITTNQDKIESSGYLPPLRFRPLDDGSILIEWIFKDFRIGFSIEPNDIGSGWYLVSNHNLNETSASGSLNSKEFDHLLSNLLLFVVNNT